MNIFAEPGTKVRFLDKNGHPTKREHAAKLLDTEQVYTVESTEVHSSSSTVTLVEVPLRKFNTVMFKKVE